MEEGGASYADVECEGGDTGFGGEGRWIGWVVEGEGDCLICFGGRAHEI